MMGGEASRTFKDSSFSRGYCCKKSPQVQRTFRILPPASRTLGGAEPSTARAIIASHSIPFPTGQSGLSWGEPAVGDGGECAEELGLEEAEICGPSPPLRFSFSNGTSALAAPSPGVEPEGKRECQ